MPILLMLIIGTVVLGNFLNLKTQTSGLARDGARAAALSRSLPARHRCGRCAVRKPLRPDQVRHRAGHHDRIAAQHPAPPRPPPGHHHGNGDDAMRRLTDADRDDRGVATIFVILAMTAIARRRGTRHRRRAVCRRSSLGAEQRRRHRSRGRHRLRSHRRPDRRLLAVPQGRPDHHRPGVRQSARPTITVDQGRRRPAPRAECAAPSTGAPRPRWGTLSEANTVPLVIADCEFRAPSAGETITLYLDDPKPQTGCSSLPGGFSQLDKAECSVPITAGGYVTGVTGVGGLQNKVVCAHQSAARSCTAAHRPDSDLQRCRRAR